MTLSSVMPIFPRRSRALQNTELLSLAAAKQHWSPSVMRDTGWEDKASKVVAA